MTHSRVLVARPGWLASLVIAAPIALTLAAIVFPRRQSQAASRQAEAVTAADSEPSKMSLVRPYLLATIALVFFVGFWVSYPRVFDEHPTFNSPRESVGYYLSQRFAGGHGFSAPLLHYDDLPEDIARALTPRDAASKDGELLPKDFAGTMLLYGGLMAIHPILTLLVSPVFALLGAWAVLRITEELFGAAAGLIAFATWLAFPPLWINSSPVFVSDPVALALFLWAVERFLAYWKDPTWGRACSMSALFAASVLFRYPNVLLMVPFLGSILLARRWNFAHMGIAMLPCISVGAIVLGFNTLVYGSPFTTGFHLGAELIGETVNYSQESFFKRRPDVLLQYVINYGTFPAVSVPIGSALISSAFLALKTSERRRVMAIVGLICFLILLFYYGQQDAWGYEAPHVNASVLRYLLPGVALVMVFAAGMTASAAQLLGRWVYVAPLLMIALSISSTISASGGTRDTYSAIARMNELRDEIIANTGRDDVVAVRIFDKALFPQRQTLTLTYALQNREPFAKGNLETWDYVVGPERFAEIAETMWTSGISLYFLPDSRTGHVAPYQYALHERGYYLRRIEAVDSAAFFKVSKDRNGGAQGDR